MEMSGMDQGTSFDGAVFVAGTSMVTFITLSCCRFFGDQASHRS